MPCSSAYRTRSPPRGRPLRRVRVRARRRARVVAAVHAARCAEVAFGETNDASRPRVAVVRLVHALERPNHRRAWPSARHRASVCAPRRSSSDTRLSAPSRVPRDPPRPEPVQRRSNRPDRLPLAPSTGNSTLIPSSTASQSSPTNARRSSSAAPRAATMALGRRSRRGTLGVEAELAKGGKSEGDVEAGTGEVGRRSAAGGGGDARGGGAHAAGRRTAVRVIAAREGGRAEGCARGAVGGRTLASAVAEARLPPTSRGLTVPVVTFFVKKNTEKSSRTASSQLFAPCRRSPPRWSSSRARPSRVRPRRDSRKTWATPTRRSSTRAWPSASSRSRPAAREDTVAHRVLLGARRGGRHPSMAPGQARHRIGPARVLVDGHPARTPCRRRRPRERIATRARPPRRGTGDPTGDRAPRRW